MCFGVVEKQGHALPVTIGAIRLDLLPLRARPSQILCVVTVPLSSIDLFDPDSGSSTRLICVFQTPKLKSKSCCPARLEAFGFACVVSWALADCGKLDRTSTTNVKIHPPVFILHFSLCDSSGGVIQL